MTGYYERKWSRSAIWCERLAYVSVIYFAVSVLLHRFDKIATTQLFLLLAVGFLLLLVALVLGIVAIHQLWTRGRLGLAQAARCTTLTVLMLLPFVWAGWLALRYPAISDLATAPQDPPTFVELARARDRGLAQGMNRLAAYDAGYGEKLADAYPEISSRRYNTGAERIYSAVRALFADRGWRIVAVRDAPQAEAPEAPEQKNETAPAAGNLIVAQAPSNIEIEAVARSQIFGFRTDVVIRIVSEEESTLVDMRSSNRFGARDLGSNAQLIGDFLTSLDQALAGLAGEG